MRTLLKILFSSIAIILLIATAIIMLPVALVLYPIKLKSESGYTKTLLFVVSVLLKLWLYPVAFIYRATYKDFASYLYNLAIINDIEGNVVGSRFFNDIFLKDKTKEPFGNIETISDNAGDNYLIDNLSITGQIFGNILNTIDKNHLQKSATPDK